MSMTDTFEITGSTHEQRSWIVGRIGVLAVTVERLDVNTFNVTVPQEYSDILTDWAEDNKLQYRMV